MKQTFNNFDQVQLDLEKRLFDSQELLKSIRESEDINLSWIHVIVNGLKNEITNIEFMIDHMNRVRILKGNLNLVI